MFRPVTSILFMAVRFLRHVLESVRNRGQESRGKSGKTLVGTGLLVLVAGTFTGTLDARFGVGAIQLSVLEIAVLVLGIALVRLFVAAVLRKLKRKLLKGVLGGIGLSVALPAAPVSLPALSSVGAVLPSFAVRPFERVSSRLSGRLSDALGIGPSRFERLKRAVGGGKGVATGGFGSALVGYGAEVGRLTRQYTVFGQQISLLTVFLLLSAPGAAVYAVRNW